METKVCGICKKVYSGDYCPTCSGQTETMPLEDTRGVTNVCFTEPVEDRTWGNLFGGYSETRPADNGYSETRPAGNGYSKTRPTVGVGTVSGGITTPAEYLITEDVPVRPVSPISDSTGTVPPSNYNTEPAPELQLCVEGWLVATTGKNRGKDYQIRGFNTSIGREEGQIILKDPMVSRVNSCSIKYYSNTQQFFLYMGGNATNPVYINGAPLHEHQELHAYDDILIGQEHYVFVPLCGKTFQWKG